MRDMQQVHGTSTDSERHPAKFRDSERHVATPWDRIDGERLQATIEDSERHSQPLVR